MKSEGAEGQPPALPTAPPPTDPTRSSALSAAPPTTQPAVPSALFRALERYEILNEHGRGGLGRVSRAHDRELGRDVAIKELISRTSISEARFLREAMITARLEHPGIVPMYEAGRWPDGTPYYAMKLVSGRPLRDLIAERTTVDHRIGLLHHVIAVADAIAYAHGRNIIHRDLKPANVIVGDFGETIVIDWGLAKDLSSSDEPTIAGSPAASPSSNDLTATGAVLGTPSYMAPEQERGEHVDQRADVFAIGAMLWELCSLQRVPPTNLRQRRRLLRRAGIDQDLAIIIDKALDPDPSRRYSDAGTLAADLKAFKSGARIAARHYSLLAMLVHWTHRRRTVATSLVAAAAIASSVVVLYVRNITIERDKADAARSDAEHQRQTATSERDRAQLSEAALLLEKDPTRARTVLLSTAARNPQRALLLARAETRSASQILHLDSRVGAMQAAGPSHEVAIVTISGRLLELDLDTSTLQLRDDALSGPLTFREGRWCYPQTRDPAISTLASSCGVVANVGTLLRKPTSKLLWATHTMYALEAGDLYRLEATSIVRIGQRVRGIAGSNRFLMICTEDGRLHIEEARKRIVTSTCEPNDSAWPMAADEEHYVALHSATELISDRGMIHLPVAVKAEYELALGSDGLIAFGDFNGGAWIVRPRSLHAEPVAQRTSHPMSVAARGTLVGFGYADGAIIVVDVAHDHRWEFVGHEGAVPHLIVDPMRMRVVSSSKDELRIWDLRGSAISVASALPCAPFHIEATKEPRTFAIDCSDGRARIWALDRNSVRTLHTHHDLAFGIALYGAEICTGGWDGQVLCTRMNDGGSKSRLASAERLKVLTSCKDKVLIAATADGHVWEIDGIARILYTHRDAPMRVAINGDCTRVATGAYDGSLIAYDLVNNRLAGQQAHAHTGRITHLSFEGDDIATSGIDGSLRRWRIGTNGLELMTEKHETGPVIEYHRFSDGWTANVNERTFVMNDVVSRPDIRLDIGRTIADIAISPDERYIAFADVDEIIVIDRKGNAIAAAHKPGSDITCVMFVESNMLAACDSSAILTLSLTALNFSPLNSI